MTTVRKAMSLNVAPGCPLMRAGVVPALRTLMLEIVTSETGPTPTPLPLHCASQVRLLSSV
jgi:hypothetical protein